jgi:hypothetical protein
MLGSAFCYFHFPYTCTWDHLYHTELIENLNQIALGAMVKSTKALIEAQLAVMDKLTKEREALLEDWTPTLEGLEAASKITKLKSFKSTTFISKPIPGGVQTFLLPEDGISMKSIQPNPEASRIHSTRFRPPPGQEGTGAPTGPAPLLLCFADQKFATLEILWSEIPINILEVYVNSMHNRCMAVINDKGGHTKYLFTHGILNLVTNNDMEIS